MRDHPLKIKYIGLLFLFFIYFISCSTEPLKPRELIQGDYSYAISYLDWLVREHLVKNKIPGCAVAVVDEHSILYTRGYGFADMREKIPVKPTTFFRAGSISKTLTALAIMQLAEQGKIDIDAPLTSYLPSFSVKSHFVGDNTVTLRHLLSHKSGIIRDYYAGIMGEELLSYNELVEALSREYLCYRPGQAYKYSNVGYSLLGLIIETLSGEKFEQYMYERILKPLGMIQSSFVLTPDIEQELAVGTMRKSFSLVPQAGEYKDAVQVPYLDIRDKPAGGLFSNVLELSRLIRYLISGKNNFTPHLVNAATFADMCTVQFQNAPHINLFASDYGLGLKMNKFYYQNINDIIYHDGNVNGFYSIIVFSPSQKIGMVILCNSESGMFMIYDLVSRALKNFMEAKNGAQVGFIREESQESMPPLKIDLKAYAGWYATSGISAQVYLKDEELYLRSPATKFEFRLVPVKENLFKALLRILFFDVDVARQIGFDRGYAYFRLDGNGARYLFIEGFFSEVKAALALEEIEPCELPADFLDYCGEYEMVRDKKNSRLLDLYLPIKEYKLNIVEGWLMLTTSGLPVALGFILKPISDQEAIIMGSGEVVYFNNDSISFSGLILRKK